MRRMTREDIEEEEEEFRRALDAIPPPIPPDGGWGWVIVCASFLMNMIVDGVCYSYGILMPSLIETFKTSTAMMSLGGAMLLGTYMMSGPVASALCNKIGSRKVAVFGCLISTVSILASHALERGSAFSIVFGLCGGVGFGFMFLASLLVVGFYFERNRGIAATLAMCGSSVGMAVMAPLTRWLIDRYEWTGCIIILSGIVMQGFVLGALLRPIDGDLRRRKKLILKRMEEDKRIGVQTCIILQRLIEQKRYDRTLSSGSLNNGIITRDNLVIREKDFHKHGIFSGLRSAFSRSSINISPGSGRPTPNLQTKRPHAPSALTDGTSCHSETVPMMQQQSPSPASLHRQVLLSQSGQIRKNNSARSLDTVANQCGPIGDVSREFSSAHDIPQYEVECEGQRSASTERLLRKFLHATPDVDRPMYRKDIYYTGSVQILPEFHDDINSYVASITEIPDTKSIADQDFWSRLPLLPKPMKDVLRNVFDADTFKSPTYILLVVSTSLTMVGYYIPFLLLPSYAVNGTGGHISEQSAAYLLTALGFSNTFGRLISGVLATRNWLDSVIINNLALLIAGAMTLVLPFCESYFLLVVFSFVFGLCVAAFSSLRSVIVVELMGLDKLTTCYSQLVIFHGISVLIGAPVAGYLLDKYNYFYPFYFAGGCMLLSGLLSMFLRKVAQVERRKSGHGGSQSSSENEMKMKSLGTPHEIVGLG